MRPFNCISYWRRVKSINASSYVSVNNSDGNSFVGWVSLFWCIRCCFNQKVVCSNGVCDIDDKIQLMRAIWFSNDVYAGDVYF